MWMVCLLQLYKEFVKVKKKKKRRMSITSKGKSYFVVSFSHKLRKKNDWKLNPIVFPTIIFFKKNYQIRFSKIVRDWNILLILLYYIKFRETYQ